MRPSPSGSPNRAHMVVCDVRGILHPDQPTLDGLARLGLTARRHGATLRLQNACPALVDLIVWAGLADVLVVVGPEGGSGVEVQGEVEEREEAGVDEEVLLDEDAT